MSVRHRLGRIDATGRHVIEIGLLVVIGLLTLTMLGFVGLYTFQSVPFVGAIYDEFLTVGEWMNYYLGTRVFRHPPFWQSFATAVFVGVVAPLVGTFLIHRQMALIGETLAHTAFAGVAFGFLFAALTGWDGSLLWAALLVSLLGALGVQWLTENTNTFGDVPIAIVLVGSFAVATLAIEFGRGRGYPGVDIEGFLFGSLAIVTPEGTRMMAILSTFVIAAIVFNYKQLLYTTFDEQAARVTQLPVDRYNTLLIVMTAVVVVGAMQILGVILVASMLVIPPATASQIARSFRETLYLSIIVGQASVLGGFAFSLWASVPAGGSIVVVAIVLYLSAIAVSGRSVAALSTH